MAHKGLLFAIHTRPILITACGLAAMLGLVLPGPLGAARASGVTMAAAPGAAPRLDPVRQVLGHPLPMVFSPDDSGECFEARAGGFLVSVGPGGASFATAGRPLLHLDLVASRAAAVEGRTERPGRLNYLLGNDPARWRRNVPTYGEAVCAGAWPGIDVAFRGGRGSVKYEFRLRPGADPAAIRLAYRGADRIRLDAEGNLQVVVGDTQLVDERPRSWQEIDGRRVAVESAFVVHADEFGMWLGDYDSRYDLVIDPGLAYSTFVGVPNEDQGSSIAVDRAGNAYVTGFTRDARFPVTPGAFDETFNHPGTFSNSFDAFVLKLSADGSTLIYSTYLGGSEADYPYAIAIDEAGCAYVTGRTESPDFPTTAGALDGTNNGDADAFVTKLDSDGSDLVYSTYLGGAGQDIAWDVTIDGSGSAYVVGSARAGFPTTAGAFDTTLAGVEDAFISKLDPAGASLGFSTVLGGHSAEFAHGIVLDSSGDLVVVGATSSEDFPVTAGAFDPGPHPELLSLKDQAFVARLTADGSSLLQATYLGGSGEEFGWGVALDAVGNVHVVGFTSSQDFPTTAGAPDTVSDGDTVLRGEAFVAKLNPALSGLLYATYLGGSNPGSGGAGNEAAFDIVVDTLGRAHVVGWTDSVDFPTTPNAPFPVHSGGPWDGFIATLDPGGSLVMSTFLGGDNWDFGQDIAITAGGSLYVTGYTFSNDFPTAGHAFDTTHRTSADVFVVRFGFPTGDLFSNGAGRIWRMDASNPGDLKPIGSCAMSGFGAAFDADGILYVGEVDGLSVRDRNFQLLGKATVSDASPRAFFPVVRRPGQVIACNANSPGVSRLFIFDTSDLSNPTLANVVDIPFTETGAQCRDMAVDAYDQLWVCSSGSLIRLRLDAAGNVLASAIFHPGGNPFGIAIEPATGRIFYAAVGSGFIGVVDPADPATRIATIENVEDTAFSLQDVAFDLNGNLYAGCRAVAGAVNDVFVFPASVLANLSGTVDASVLGGIPYALSDFGMDMGTEGLLFFNAYGKRRDPITIDAGLNFAILSEDQALTVLAGSAATTVAETLHYRWLEGTTVLKAPTTVVGGQCPLNLGSLPSLGVGDHALTLEVAGCCLTVRDSIVVTIENSPPTAAPTGGGVYVRGQNFNVSGEVADFDGDTLCYEWRFGATVLASGTVATPAGGAPVALPVHSLQTTALGVGMHTVELAVDDGVNDEVVASIEVEVVEGDVTAPTCHAVPSTTILWPPDHNMREVAIQVEVEDDSGGPLDLSVSVSSTEPPDAAGDGSTIPDYEILEVNDATGLVRLNLRAERAGRGDGRVYTITVTVTDAAGNSSTCTVEIQAPHSQGGTR